MIWKSSMKIILCIVIFCVWTLLGNAQQLDAPYLSSQQREVVQKWITRNPSFRLATEVDCEDREGLKGTREEYGSGYNPYYVAGDFNHDDNDDFALVLIDKRKNKDKYAVLIFNGQSNGEYGRIPAYFEGSYDLRNGGLFYFGYGRGDRLAAGVFMSDICVGLRAHGRGYERSACGLE